MIAMNGEPCRLWLHVPATAGEMVDDVLDCLAVLSNALIEDAAAAAASRV